MSSRQVCVKRTCTLGCAGGYGEEFRQKMRSVLYNLKDDKNQDFRGKVLRGEVPPAKICTMEPHDMASEV